MTDCSDRGDLDEDRVAAIIAALRDILCRMDELGLQLAAAHVSLSIDLLEEGRT